MLTHNAQPAEVQYGCVFAENFNSASECVKNSGTVTGEVKGGKLYCVSGTGASFSSSKMEDFLNYGGSLRIRWNLNETGASSRPVLFYGIDANYGIEVLHKGSDGAINVQLRNGSGNNYYLVSGNVAANQVADIVVTWNKAGTTLTLLVNGVYADNDASAGSLVYTMGTTYGAMQVGYATGLTPSTDITIDEIRVYKTTIIAAFGSEGIALDYYKNSTFNYDKRATFILPMTADCHDATNLKILDTSGKGNDFTIGNGATATTYPTKLQTRGYSFDGGDYFKKTFTLASGTYSMIAVAKKDANTTKYLFDNRGAGAGAGLAYWEHTGGNLTVFGGGTIYIDGKVTQKYKIGVPEVYVFTGETWNVADYMMIGINKDGSNGIDGAIYYMALYPFTLTPLQVWDITLKLKKQLNLT